MSKKNELSNEQLGKVAGGEVFERPIGGVSTMCSCQICSTVFDAKTVESQIVETEITSTGASAEAQFKCPTCKIFVPVTFCVQNDTARYRF